MTRNKKKRIYITRSIEGLDELQAQFPSLDIAYNESQSNLSHDALLAEAKRSDGLITMLCDNIDSQFLEQNAHLKVISNYAVGLNNIDLNKAREKGIQVGHTPDVLTHSTAETAIMLLMNLAREFSDSIASVKRGEWKTWEPTRFNGYDLRHKKIGIIGFGRIGQDFAKKASALWSNEILILKRESYKNLKLPDNYKLVEEDEFLENVDVISLHCPLNNQSQKLIDGNFVKKLAKPIFFINTARGQIHDEQVLLEALKKGRMLGVGLDVTDPEPMELNNLLLSHPKALVLPHIGSATFKTRKEMTKMCLENVRAGLNDENLPYCAF